MSDDQELLKAIAQVRRSPYGKRVVHVFTSWAKGDPKHPEKLAKGRDLVSRNLFNIPDSGCFVLSSGDMVFICAQVSAAVIQTVCSRLETLFFGEEPPRVNSYGEAKYFKVFDAGRDLAKLITSVKALVSVAPVATRPAIGLKEFEAIVRVVRDSDIRAMIFNQPVYRWAGKKPGIEYLEFFASLDQIRQAACPEHDIAGNPALFHLIKAELDLRLMRIIGREVGEYRHKAFSINLLGTSLLSKEFETFMDGIPARLSGKIFAEIDRGDFLQHSGDLDALTRRSADLNVPLCVDGLSLSDLRVFRLPTGAEFAKIKWSEQITTLPRRDLEVAIRAIKEFGPEKVVLTRCDSERALDFAQAMGIPFVQGYLADKMFRAGINFNEGRGQDEGMAGAVSPPCRPNPAIPAPRALVCPA